MNNQGYILEHQSPHFIYSWITILIITLLIFLLIGNNFKYNSYYFSEGTIIKDQNQYYTKTFLKKEQLPTLLTKPLLINQQIIHYQVIKIGNQYLLNNELYIEVWLNLKLDKSYLLEGNMLNLQWLIDSTTFIQEIIQNTKKGLIQWNN